MKRILFALVLTCCALPCPAATVSVTGKLVDRQCSVEDVYQLQPQAERYCTITLDEAKTVNGPTGEPVTYHRRITAYCPKLTIKGTTYASYSLCADPYAMQINHPTKLYIVQGDLREPGELADGRGEFIVTQAQY
jgi:hypothetical protein